MTAFFQLAHLAHLPALLRLMGEFNREGGYPADLTRTRALLEEFLTTEKLGHAWLIEVDGVVAGYLVVCYCFSFEHGGRDAFLDEIYLEPAFRRQGFGRAALVFAQKHCASKNIQALHLEVERDNAAARALYEKAGFHDPQRPLMTWKP